MELWNPNTVQNLLQFPQRVMREEPWSDWVKAQGGLAGLYSQLRGLPLPSDQRRVLDLLLELPGYSASTYADHLHIHFTTYYRHLRRLLTTLCDFLNAQALAETIHYPLPAPTTPLIGREAEIQTVAECLNKHRLVTILGPGGTGKTRLALAVAQTLQAAWRDGVVWVPLAQFDTDQPNADWVVTTVAAALGIKEPTRTNLKTAVNAFLASRRLVLILDNFEHIVGAVSLLSEWLRVAPHVSILVTSRTVLHCSGEHVFPLQPLPVTDIDAAGVQLFLARASNAGVFVDVARHTAVILEICNRLDGLPLALELAAACLRVLNPTELLARLDHRMGLLIGGPHDLPERQQTLRAAIDWSYRLLAAQPERLFCGLCLFTSGWTLEQAHALLAPADELTTLQALASLHDASLIFRVDETRWTMLQTIREFGTEQLMIEPDFADLYQRAADWITRLVEQTADTYASVDQAHWLAVLDAEMATIRTLLPWMLSHIPLQAAEVVGHLWRFWWSRGLFREGCEWLSQTLELQDQLPQPSVARILKGLGALWWSQGDLDRAEEYFGACLALELAFADPVGAAMTRNNLGLVVIERGDYRQAEDLFTANLDEFRRANHQYALAASFSNLGMVALYEQRWDDAEALFNESLTLRQQIGNAWGIAASLINLATLERRTGAVMQAGQRYLESLALLEDVEEPESLAECFEGLAAVVLELGAPELAAQLVGAAAQRRAMIGAPLSVIEQDHHRHTINAIQKVVNQDAFEVACAAGGSASTLQLSGSVRELLNRLALSES